MFALYFRRLLLFLVALIPAVCLAGTKTDGEYSSDCPAFGQRVKAIDASVSAELNPHDVLLLVLDTDDDELPDQVFQAAVRTPAHAEGLVRAIRSTKGMIKVLTERKDNGAYNALALVTGDGQRWTLRIGSEDCLAEGGQPDLWLRALGHTRFRDSAEEVGQTIERMRNQSLVPASY